MKFILALVVLGLLYVRFSPVNPTKAHVTLENPDKERHDIGSYLVSIENRDVESFAHLHGLILSTPRTKQIAGSLDDGHVSYVTRSLMIGFPDITTIKLAEDGSLWIYGRLVYGRSDFNVNKTRIQNWVQQL